jgi:tetratricopeptide (TPR) repeat protein
MRVEFREMLQCCIGGSIIATEDVVSRDAQPDRGAMRISQVCIIACIIAAPLALALAPASASAASTAAQTCIAQTASGNYAAAVAACTDAINENPSDSVSYDNRCDAYANSGNYSGAIADCTRAIALDPKLETAYNNRCASYNRSNDYAAALNDCTQAIALDAKDETPYVGRCTPRTTWGALLPRWPIVPRRSHSTQRMSLLTSIAVFPIPSS